MHRHAGLVLIGLLGSAVVVGLSSAGQGETPKKRADVDGEPLPLGAVSRLGDARLLHPSPPRKVAFTPDGLGLVSLAGDSLWYWRVADGRLMRRLKIHHSARQSAAISRDGKLVATGTLRVSPGAKRGAIRVIVLDAGTGRRIKQLDVAAEPIMFGGALRPPMQTISWPPLDMAFTPDGKGLITSDLPARLWDLTKGVVVRTFAEKGERAYAVALSRDGEVLATSDKAGQVRLWDVGSGKLVKKLLKTPSRADQVWARRLAFSPDGRLLACLDTVGVVRIWNVAKEEPELALKLPGHVLAQSFTHDGTTLVVCEANAIRFWDVRAGKELTRRRIAVPLGQASRRHVAVSRDGRLLAATLGDPSCCPGLWELPTGKRRFSEIDQHRHTVASADFSRDGRFVFTLSGGLIRKWNARTGRLVMKVRESRETWERDMIRVLPDGKGLVSIGRSAAGARLWDVATGKRMGKLMPVDTHFGMAISPDGRLLATTEGAMTARLWQLPSARLMHTFKTHSGNAWPPMFTPDGRRLICRTQIAFILDVKTGKRIKTVAIGSVFHLMYPITNSSFMVDYADGRRVDFRSFHDGSQVQSFQMPAPIYGYRLSSDERFLVTIGGSGDFKVRVWELIAGQGVLTFAYGSDFARDVAVSPDGRRAATLGPNALVWSLDPWDHTCQERPGATDLKGLWRDLGLTDAAKAYRAAWAMRHISAPSVTLLGRELTKALAAQKPVAKMIADLDSDKWHVRVRASKELASLSGAVEETVRRTLKRTDSAEVRHRLSVLLERGYGPIMPLERRRHLRAVMILEWIGGERAKRVLRRVTAGQADYPLTESAKAALKRLDGRARE